MSVSARDLRQAARRCALLGLRGAYAVSGVQKSAGRDPGVTLLLLHNTPPPLLARLLRFVDRRRDQVTDFASATAALAEGTVSRPMIALTFDDGFRSNLAAGRALAARSIGACFYVPTGVVGMSQQGVDNFFRRPQAEGVMNWDDLELLRSQGHTVGSHCRAHLPLSEMESAEAEDQVKSSVSELRTRLGAIGHFAWPYGSLRHAHAADVVRWCREIDVVAASGVRGRNKPKHLQKSGYLLRDAVDLRWVETDFRAFTSRSHLQVRKD